MYRFARLRFRLSTSMHCRPCRPFADISFESTRNLAPEHAAHTPRAAHGELTARAQHTPFLDETSFKPGQGSHLCSICEAHILMRKYRSPFSRENGRLAQRERRCLTSTRSQVQILYRPPLKSQVRRYSRLTFSFSGKSRASKRPTNSRQSATQAFRQYAVPIKMYADLRRRPKTSALSH